MSGADADHHGAGEPAAVPAGFGGVPGEPAADSLRSGTLLGRAFGDAPSRELEGLVSHVLLQEGDPGDPAMTVTWVDVAPSSRQRPHRHAPQQVYVVVDGEGIMHVDRATRRMRRGDLALVASNAEHWIENASSTEPLHYVSASAPAFRVTDLYDSGALSGGDR